MSILTREEYLATVKHEMKVVRHLFGKILPDTWDWRPTAKQRSILELLQYISHSTASGMHAVLDGSGSIFTKAAETSKEVTKDNFLAKLDEQEAQIEEIFAKLTDEELEKSADLWGSGNQERKGLLLINLVLKGLVAYRMQLFLYIKASGREDIGTSDVWQGVDSKPQA